MKRELALKAAINRLLTFGPEMAELDRIALENKIVGDFEDIIPTYKGVKDDGVSRLYEYALRSVNPEVEVKTDVVEIVEPEFVIEESVKLESEEVAEPVIEKNVESEPLAEATEKVEDKPAEVKKSSRGRKPKKATE